MQPPPQAVPPAAAGPPPAGNPRSMFWANSPYRKPASNNAPVAPITRPLQPVTDPFAFNRQTLQNTPVGNSSKSSLPNLPGPALPVLSQWPGLPVPPTNAGDSPTSLHEPQSGALSQPRADSSLFPPAPAPSSLPGLQVSRSAEGDPSSGPDVQMLPHPPHYIPGVGPEQPHGGYLNDSGSGPDQPMNRHVPHDGAVAHTASPFLPQPQMPGQWGPVQGGPQPSCQHHSPYLEGPVQNMGPQAASLAHFPSPSSLHQGPGHESHVPHSFTPASLASGEGNEIVHQQSKNHPVSSFPPKHTFEQTSRVGNMWASPELRQNPGLNKEHLLDPAHVNPFTQGTSPDNQVHHPPVAATNHAVQEAASGALSMFFQGEEAENEENLSSEKAGLDDRLDLDSFSSTSRLGHPPPGAGGVYQAFLKDSSSEAAQEGDTQPYFSQSVGIRLDKQTTMTPANDTWGDIPGAETHCASGPQCENVENLEFVQNQEVLPRETLNVDPFSLSDQTRYGPLPGPAASRPVTVGLTRGGGLNLEAPDLPLHPTRPDSVSSSYSSHSHRSPPGSTRPQELVGTFIQQEVGKLEDDTSGSFFKQIDSSPVGGETDEVTGSQNYCSSLSQPSTPSPPKPTGVFQTSANSSFEPVKSHLVGVKPVEADRANMVVEVRGTRNCPKKRRAAVVPPDATPGNLEQPPDNMETLCAPQACPLPLSTTSEAGQLVSHTAGPPLDTVRPVPDKRPSARAQGPVKCESPATTLWAQNELPDFGGNVLLAPAAPALYVPVKPKPSEVLHHPEKGMSGQQSWKQGSMPPLQNQDPPGASENLENPPKVGEEEALPLQVTKDAQDQYRLERAQPELVPPRPQNSPQQVPQAACPEPSNPESPPTQGQSESLAQPPASPAPVNPGQLPPRPPQSSSASVTSTNSSQAAVRSEQPWLHPPPPSTFGPAPQDLASYYYYRPLYDAYQSQYPSPYPSDPGTASLYYQDMYGLYEPRYRPYDSSSASAYAENHRYSEPERPSSRASHYSDQLTPRQGYPEGYYNSKSGWSSHSDYYANYYSGQYDYGDPSRWDRYYGSRFRDPRSWDRRYWYDSDPEPYRKDHYAYSDRPEKCDDHWRYDPRFTGSFDDDTDLHRDPYGEEADRRSIHSEHSARSLRSTHSLPSRRSSLSSHSHQSQMYRSHHVTGGSFEGPHAPGSFHGDYAYGTYASNFSGAHGFPEYSYPADSSWPAVEQVPSRPTSPEKFTVPHVCARFGPGGQLLKVIPNLPSEGQPALVEIHSLETLLQHTPEQEEMRSFPGPLGKDDTHKVDVINFAQNKATKCLQNESLIDKESASLLWNFIILLCRQNGTVVGTDIAELLLRDHRTVWLPGKSPNEANLIDFTNEAVEQVEEEESGEAQLSFLTDSQTVTTSVLEKETERFRELLLYGRKKDALESAMKNGLWGHALLLASKMDSRTHARVMTRFANSLPINDPLQTVYQLMSGRMPAASTCCGDEKWGDWRPHLAMVLSNLNNNMDVESRTMATMGDTLASKGLLDAAHFCYLMAQVGFGVYTKKTTKLVLIGSNHSLPFLKFATNEAIQRTEAYEYAQSLGAQTCSVPNFQVFKFIYLCRLAEMGLATQAFHYCEVIAKSVLTQPGAYSPVLISQLTQMASQLRLFDPQLKEKPEEESFVEPAWLVQLRHVERQIQEGTVLWSQDGTEPQQCHVTSGSEVEQSDGPGLNQQAGPRADNPLLMPSAEPLMHGVQLLPTAPQTLPDGQPAHLARVPMFPVPMSHGPLELSPAYGPPGSALGFPESSRSDPAVLHPGRALPPTTPGLQESGPPLQEARSPDPAEMVPQGSPVRHSPPELSEEEFGENLADLGSSRTAQDLETSPVWDLSSSSLTQPPSLTSDSEGKKPAQVVKKEPKEPKKTESWFSRWLPGKKRTEAYLPDDKNKSIVWDEKKNQWVNLNEPEEEKKAPPPPPTSFPRVPQVAPTGPAGPPTASVNVFSRKAGGSRARYVDVLNPSGTQRSEPALAPADFFAPLAPLPIPSNLFVPNPDAEEPQSADGTGCRGQAPAGTQSKAEPTLEPKVVSSTESVPGPELLPSKPDGAQGGELSRCSSLSSLSQEVSRHFHQAPGDHYPAGLPPGGSVPFYNPAQLVQASVTSGNSRPGRIGQRKYAALN
ncbi:protein transport protein Sec16A isoform X4 [Apodemus sylvaticus]|uniref:protein transport protein Sec16A isoform X4 n=1 Tax=Apodemus sylvaticus TaxID=10129 RepID=UPI002243390C|nr:protein transport protein Sec16A isoform X4 [Apodemus sylvaticus]